MERPGRLEPTVFLAMISPITLGLVAGSVALVLVAGGAWWIAVMVALGVYGLRILLASRLASRARALPRRIDPFALREPWRFFVSDALQAQKRFAASTRELEAGPLRDRLLEIGERVDQGVEESWEVARRGQRLTDSRRRVDLDRIRRTLQSSELAGDDPRRTSAQVQLEAHDRMRHLEDDTKHRLEILDARLEESVVRATELTARSHDPGQLEEIADAVEGIVGDLESLRLGLEAADGAAG